MDFLKNGKVLSWNDTKKNSFFARQKGIDQFLNIYNTFKNRNSDYFKYGDEVEFSLVKFDHSQKKVYLLLKADQLLAILETRRESSLWTPEFANYMVEAIPLEPYNHDINSILEIEANMILRRKQLQSFLGPNEFAMTFSTFPLISCSNFTYPSISLPSEVIYKANTRYFVSYENIQTRKKSENILAKIPIFKNENKFISIQNLGACCSCLQVTFQANCLDEACRLYDQLAPLTPIILALSASSPIWCGYLTDIDCRWKVLADLLDDRTLDEKNIFKVSL